MVDLTSVQEVIHKESTWARALACDWPLVLPTNSKYRAIY
jgi:hypothetical protein